MHPFRLAVCLWACLLPNMVSASDAPHGYVSIVVENDVMVSDRDRHYSNGFRIDWVPKERRSMLGLTGLLEGLLLSRPEGSTPRPYLQFGQNMYTPSDITDPELIEDDHPFGGWLYLTTGVELATPRWTDQVELTLGLVGPASQAGRFQRAWHRWFGFRPANGWPNQLRNEPGINLAYRRQWHLPLGADNGGPLLSLHPHAGASLGNVFTYAATGLTLQLSKGTSWRTLPRISPALPGSGIIGPTGGSFGWSVFIGVEGRAVARNIFLDGNTFRDSHGVRSKALVGDLTAGFIMVLDGVLGLPPVRLTFSITLRSGEFDGQDGSNRFGGVSVTFAY